jgi:hypothetical protein
MTKLGFKSLSPAVFLLWNIVYLAALSALVRILFLILGNFTIRKQFVEYRNVKKYQRDSE